MVSKPVLSEIEGRQATTLTWHNAAYLSNMYPGQYPDWQGRRSTKSIFISIAGGLWLIALALPAYSDDTPGLGAFIFGWMMIFDGDFLAFVGWLANLPFLTGIFMFIFGRRPAVIRATLILSVIAAVFSLGAFTVDEVPSYQSNHHVSPYIGCYTWVIANMLLMIGTIIYVTRQTAIVRPSSL